MSFKYRKFRCLVFEILLKMLIGYVPGHHNADEGQEVVSVKNAHVLVSLQLLQSFEKRKSIIDYQRLFCSKVRNVVSAQNNAIKTGF